VVGVYNGGGGGDAYDEEEGEEERMNVEGFVIARYFSIHEVFMDSIGNALRIRELVM
jgi:hypothetical protein